MMPSPQRASRVRPADHVPAMPPAIQLGSLTETRLSPLARNPDHRYQLEEFRKILLRPARIRRHPILQRSLEVSLVG